MFSMVCSPSGKLFFEKKTPDRSIIGSVIRITVAPIVGMLLVRDAHSNAIAVKAPAPRIATNR